MKIIIDRPSLPSCPQT